MRVKESRIQDLHLILHDVRSVFNVGSLFRTADAAGVSKLYLTGYTPSPVDRFGRIRKDLAKVALGAEHTVPWESHASVVSLIRALKRDGFVVAALEQDKRSKPYTEIKGEKIALIVGNETGGIPASVLRHADTIAEIPMRGAMVRHAHHPKRSGIGKESLNVSVAAGIMLFSLRR